MKHCCRYALGVCYACGPASLRGWNLTLLLSLGQGGGLGGGGAGGYWGHTPHQSETLLPIRVRCLLRAAQPVLGARDVDLTGKSWMCGRSSGGGRGRGQGVRGHSTSE